MGLKTEILIRSLAVLLDKLGRGGPTEIARLSKMSRAGLEKIARGEVTPTLESWEKLYDAFPDDIPAPQYQPKKGRTINLVSNMEAMSGTKRAKATILVEQPDNAIPITYIDVYRLAPPPDQEFQDKLQKDKLRKKTGDPQVTTDGGKPVGKIEHKIPVATRLVDEDSFGIFVPDDSMEPRILQDSVAAITPSAPLRNGDICFAMLPGGKQVLRRYKKIGKTIVLEGFNEKCETILLTEPEAKKVVMYRMKAVVTEY